MFSQHVCAIAPCKYLRLLRHSGKTCTLPGTLYDRLVEKQYPTGATPFLLPAHPCRHVAGDATLVRGRRTRFIVMPRHHPSALVSCDPVIAYPCLEDVQGRGHPAGAGTGQGSRQEEGRRCRHQARGADEAGATMGQGKAG